MADPIRIGLIGCGGIQRKHARTFLAREDARIVGLCDIDSAGIDRLIESVDEQGVLAETPRFSDPAAMYDQVELDAVSICTPHTMHYEHGMQALDAGAHVLMEKPMVTDASHAYEIAARKRETGKVFVVGYNTPCSPQLGYIRGLMRNNELGDLELASGFLSQNWMKNTMGGWRHDPALSGGGQAYDSGAHLLASLCWTIERPVEEVFAMIDYHGTQVDINSTINIRFEGGASAALAISGNCPANTAHMSYMFTGGRIEFQPWTAEWVKVWHGKELDENPPIEGEPTAPADNLLDAIQGKAEPRTNPDNGIIHCELMDLIYESARNDRPAHRKEVGGRA